MTDLVGCGPGDYIGHGPTDASHDRWGCLNSWLFTSRTWPDDIRHGPTDVSHNRWGCVNSWLFTSRTWSGDYLDTARKMSLMIDGAA